MSSDPIAGVGTPILREFAVAVTLAGVTLEQTVWCYSWFEAWTEALTEYGPHCRIRVQPLPRQGPHFEAITQIYPRIIARAHQAEPIETDQMLLSGAIGGPYRRPKPMTLTWRMRVSRALRAFILKLRRHLR